MVFSILHFVFLINIFFFKRILMLIFINNLFKNPYFKLVFKNVHTLSCYLDFLIIFLILFLTGSNQVILLPITYYLYCLFFFFTVYCFNYVFFTQTNHITNTILKNIFIFFSFLFTLNSLFLNLLTIEIISYCYFFIFCRFVFFKNSYYNSIIIFYTILINFLFTFSFFLLVFFFLYFSGTDNVIFNLMLSNLNSYNGLILFLLFFLKTGVTPFFFFKFNFYKILPLDISYVYSYSYAIYYIYLHWVFITIVSFFLRLFLFIYLLIFLCFLFFFLLKKNNIREFLFISSLLSYIYLLFLF